MNPIRGGTMERNPRLRNGKKTIDARKGRDIAAKTACAAWKSRSRSRLETNHKLRIMGRREVEGARTRGKGDKRKLTRRLVRRTRADTTTMSRKWMTGSWIHGGVKDVHYSMCLQGRYVRCQATLGPIGWWLWRRPWRTVTDKIKPNSFSLIFFLPATLKKYLKRFL